MIEINGKSLIKKSRLRIVISGKNVEVYKYKKPYFYNRPPQRQKVFADERILRQKDRRLDNIFAVRQKIKRIVTANVTAWGFKPLFVTFTFAENVDDPQMANPLWTIYTKKLNDFLYKRGLSSAKYLSVVEFQKRGAVHYHTIYFNIPFIEDIKVHFAKLWDNGFIKIISIDHVQYVGAYICKYLQKGLVDERLRQRKAFFTSRKLLRPITIRDEYNCFDYLQKNDTLSLSDHISIDSDRYGIIDYSIYKNI